MNGQPHIVAASPDTPLIYILRNDLALNGPKFGCGLGECGACMVLIDGLAARSCVVALGAAAGRSITTLEGLGNCRVQRAFIEAQAAQCGYCLNGMIITTRAFLAHNPHPTVTEIRFALQHNLCRCGAHIEILQAVRLAVEAA